MELFVTKYLLIYSMNMKVNLATNANFLRNKLTFIRSALLGVEKKESHLEVIKPENDKSSIESALVDSFKMTFYKLAKIGLIFISLFSISLAVILFAPQLYYRFFPAETVVLTPDQIGTPLGGEFDQGAQEEKRYLPEKNENLPEGNWLVIPRIGVRSEMLKTPTSETALEEGVWWVPDFGNPGDDLPIILVAHRYGYKWWWKTDYWRYNSFYLLPDLEPGDTIEIISDQRKWVYEVYGAEQGEQITDYDADLILYTCKSLDSIVKHFRYARLVNPNVDTQENSI